LTPCPPSDSKFRKNNDFFLLFSEKHDKIKHCWLVTFDLGRFEGFFIIVTEE
jgi:hypothetical protein